MLKIKIKFYAILDKMKFFIINTFCLILLSVSVDFAVSQCTNPSCTCYNGGVSTSTCGCICPTGYQGSQCQYATNPCTVPDEPYCQNINCHNATLSDFFRCQTKCLCCNNMKCYNSATLSVTFNAGSGAQSGLSIPVCSCSCFSPTSAQSIFDPNTQCATVLSGSCTDDSRCASQFNTYAANTNNCAFAFIKSICPLTCGVCSAAG